MIDPNHYETLQVSAAASQAEIKQAYRRLVKLFHPDSNSKTADHEQIIRVNTAYEVLGDAQKRLLYDRQLDARSQVKSDRRQQRTASTQNKYRASRQTGRDADQQLAQWLQQVYQPVNLHLDFILSSLEEQIDRLAADPFDDELIEGFQAYLITCRDHLRIANLTFRSMPNPPSVAGAAAHLYYCLNQVGDGIEQLEFFPLNYDEHYLHMGQELFRIAHGLHCKAQIGLEAIA
ncbi:MAG: J domain-containing protein [Chroococcidiopsidaceae cyanobacterium CP_BM_RX_35]|nr:J domain-containing protein [Chroococcidiopsidaceae cyanobacterium CP_BM_RX_35]